MSILISNGTSLYRYPDQGNLLRTPLKRLVKPQKYLSYVVAGAYSDGKDKAMPAQNLPFHGIQLQATTQNTRQVGFDLLTIYRSPTDARQQWQVMNGGDRGAVWYQGGFGTSATNANAPITSEACMSMSASRFHIGNIPSGVDFSMSLGLRVGGVMEAYLAPGSTKNTVWKYSSSFPICYAVLPLNMLNDNGPTNLHWSTIRNYNQGAIDLLPITKQLASNGLNGFRDFWGYENQTRNGGIPTLMSIPEYNVQLTTTAVNVMKAYCDFWFVLYYEPQPYNGMTITNYGPSYSSGAIGWWACSSVFNPTITVQIGD